MQTGFHFEDVDAQQTIIITASRRQSRFIREQYAEYQLQKGLEVWPSLKVMPWQAFINFCWDLVQQDSVLPSRLTPVQSQYLWQKIVADSEVTQSLLNSRQTQKLSYDAWRICQQWQIKALDYLPGDQDQTAFETWFNQYQKLLSEKGWIDPHQQANLLLEQLDKFVEQLPNNIISYGFQQPSPQQEALLQALEQHKQLTYWHIEAPSNENAVTIYSLPEPKQELLAAVRWAKEKLLQNRGDEPQQQIAIVVPDLQSQRSYIERLIQREFYAQSLIQGKDVLQPMHDFSIDEPLLQQPMVAVLMDVLSVVQGSVTKSQLQHLLLSPYLYKEQEDHWQATRLELVVRKSNKAFYSRDDLLKLTRHHQVACVWLKAVIQWLQETDLSANDYTTNMQFILELLAKLHWSGYNTLSSREYQVQQTFIESIKSSQSLQRVTPDRLPFAKTLNLLKTFLEQQGFHQQQPRAPLQIVGLLEAIGLKFDSVWLVGATDQALPQKAVPNPFLSKALQLKYQLPGSSHQRELDYAQSLLDSLRANAELVISFSEHDGEQEQMLSPLLQKLLQKSDSHPQQYDLQSKNADFIDNWSINDELEFFRDESGKPIEQSYEVRGGTGLLRMQAASPFDAYLRYRLGLEPFEVDSLGISYMDRGNLFHRAMQKIWQRLETQQALLNLTAEEQAGLIEQTLEFVMNEARRGIYLLNNANFYQVEKLRLFALIEESLALDKEREPFTVIGTEVARTLELAGLTFSMVIDRIDQLSDGRLLIIDYKTGQPSLMSLLRDPIGEPQLLLYAISEQQLGGNVAGILFMQAHLKACKYIGMTDDEEMLSGVKALKDIQYYPYGDTFERAIVQWHEMLEQLAQDFKDGKANLTEYTGDFTDYTAISRWAQRSQDVQEIVEGGDHD